MALFYGLISLSHYWTAPVTPRRDPTRPACCRKYALFSVARILTAYLISLVFAIAYGQFAAQQCARRTHPDPLLDTLQSIPVLSFLPP
jgi:NitT/TauT family transport system permease protein